VLPDDESHADAWFRTDCLDCHERGRDDAPVVYHVGMSELLLAARCRTCHVSVEGGLEAE